MANERELRYKQTLDSSDFDKKMKSNIDLTNRMDKVMGKVGSNIAGYFAAGKLLGWGKDFISSSIDVLKKYELFSTSLKTMMHGDAIQAEMLQKQLIVLAKTTPFSLEDVQTGTKSLMAYGFQASEITKNLTMMGNVASGVGAPLNDIIYLYGTLRASGRVTTMDIRQFAGRGIPIYEALSKTMHKTTQQIIEMTSKGKVGFKDVEKAFQSMTGAGGQFFNLMEEQSKTTGGKLSNMADSWEQLQLHIAQSQSGIIAGTVDFVNRLLSSLDEGIVNMNKRDKYLSKYGGGYGFSNNVGSVMSFLGLASRSQREIDADFAGSLEKTYATNLKTEKQALDNLQKVKNLIYNTAHAPENEFNDKKARQRELSILMGVAEDISNTYKSLREQRLHPNKPTKEGKGGLTEGGLGTGTEVHGERPQSVVINITKLVETLKVETTTLQESMPRIKEMVETVLLGAVNDLNKNTNRQ